MSTTVTYKGNTLATITNQTKTLKTAGKYMEGDVAITDSSSGGTTNFVSGTFTTNASTGIQTISLPYTGSGYPVAAVVCVSGGAYNTSNTAWYDLIQQYAVASWSFSKSVMSETPNYASSGTQNQGVTAIVYKNSTTSATTYSRTSAMTTNVLSTANPSASAAAVVKFSSPTQMKVFIADASYGLKSSLEYQYFIAYSS